MEAQLKFLLIFLIFILLINPLLVSNENDEYSLGEDEEIVWTIDLINRCRYEATILTRMKNDALYFLIDSTATQIRVSEIQNEIEISHETLSSKEELEEEAIRTKNKGLEESFKKYLNGAIVLKMQIKRSDVEKLPLIVRINYNGIPESSDEPSGFIDIHKNKININFEDPQEKINRFYLILPENFDVWYRDIEEDVMDWVDGRIRLMWKNSERNIKHIKIYAGTSGDRSHWETLELFIKGIFIALIGIFFGVVKKSDEEKKKFRYLLLTIFCIIVVGLGLYMRIFPIETHWIYWTIFTLVVITIIRFEGKKIF